MAAPAGTTLRPWLAYAPEIAPCVESQYVTLSARPDPTWEKAWSEHAFEAPRSDMEAVEQEWERIRQKFLGDQRSIMGMAVRMGREYPNSTGGLITGQVAALSWEKLKMKPSFGPKKLRQIVELFSAAIGRTKT